MKNYPQLLLRIIIICLIATVFISCNENKQTVVVDKPNILLIVVDDQGYADFSPFDKHDTTISTPNITKLGKSGKIFTQAYVTAPVCSPSRAGILTGKNQFRWDKAASWGPGLPDGVKTIAEYLKELGYRTARIGKNDLGRNFHRNDVREYPLNHGYEEFLGFSAHAHDYWLNSKEVRDLTPDPNGTSAHLGPLMHNMGEKSYESGYLTDILTDASIEYIEKADSKPFFLTLSYNAVHHLIHEVPQKYLDKYGVDSIPIYNPQSLLSFGKHIPGSYAAYYDKYSRVGAIERDNLRKYYLANLECLDDNIGRVLDALDTNNLDKNTLIVFISDNGGSPLTGANNSPLTGGKYSLWEGGIRVPMAIKWSGKIKQNSIEHQYVSATDILPTLVEAGGGKIVDTDIDGINLLNPVENRLLVWKWQKTWAVRRGDWKLTNANENHWKSEPSTQYIKPIMDNTDLKLFNLKTDPGEREDLSSEYPEKVIELEHAFNGWCKENIK